MPGPSLIAPWSNFLPLFSIARLSASTGSTLLSSLPRAFRLRGAVGYNQASFMTMSPATRLGPYEIISALGAGGMGEVYRARDTKLQRDVALKLLPTHPEPDPVAFDRFQREARALAALNHPNIVTIYAVDEIDGQAFLAMELINGPTLAD